MKINKLFAFGTLLLASLAFTACDDDDDYAPGQPAGQSNVTFEDDGAIVVAKTATNFDIKLNRHSTGDAQTVSIEKANVPEGWEVPESASFAAGDSIASITVTLGSDMALNTSYPFEIHVANEYANPYKNQAQSSVYGTTVTKEDYETFATGTYDEEFFFGAQWPVTIEYSPALDIFRIKSMFGPAGEDGYNFFFKWNQKTDATQEFSMVSSNGGQATRVPTGFTYSSYGMVNVTWAAKTNDPAKATDSNEQFGGYYAAGNMFVLPFTHRVSAGSFGDGSDYIRDVQFVTPLQ